MVSTFSTGPQQQAFNVQHTTSWHIVSWPTTNVCAKAGALLVQPSITSLQSGATYKLKPTELLFL
jgi:hypothetical protein